MTTAASTVPPISRSVERLLPFLACPDCRGALRAAEQRLACSACGRDYGLTPDGTPVLFARASEFADREAAFCNTASAARERRSAKRPLTARLLPRTTPYHLTRGAYERAMRGLPDGPLLNLGAGRRRVDAEADRWVNLDIRPAATCDVVADAHWLPFKDASVAGVVSANVFEYLRDPFRVASEIKRILRPGGTVYVNVAFILPLSTPDYHDRFRFTRRGLQSLFGDLEVLESGPSSGPVVGLASVADRALDSAIPGKLPSYAIRWLAAWALQPFKYLDPAILRRDRHELSAAGFYLVARKPHAGGQ